MAPAPVVQQPERLCRLMCGKALPFRDDAILENSGEAQPRRHQRE